MSELVPVGFETRAATTEDIVQMTLVKMRADAGEANEPLPTNVPDDYEYLEEIEKRMGRQDPWSHLVRDLDKDRLAGFACGYAGNWRGVIEPSTNDQYLWLLMVDPEYQGNGLGRALLNMAADTTRDFGADTLSLYAPVTSQRAHSLYEDWGFEIHGAIISDTDGELINYKLAL